MFNKNVFTQTDAVADLIKGINEADYKAKMEALKGNQHKIDKNKNNEIDAHDFKILRGEKKVNEEQVEEADTSVKIPTSTGTRVLGHRYGNAAKTHRDSLADPFAVVKGPGQKDMEALGKKMAKKEEIDPNVTTTDTLTGRVAGKSANPFLKAKVKLNVNEEELDGANKESEKDFQDRQKRLAAAGAQTAKDPARLKRMMNIPGYSAAMDLAKKTTTKEEAKNEQEDKGIRQWDKPNFGLSIQARQAKADNAKKEDPPFDGPYKKPDTKPGHGDASRVKHLAKMAIPKTTKEETEDLEEAKFDPLKHIDKKNQTPAIKAAAKLVKPTSYADRADLNKAGGVKDDRGPRGVTQEEVEELDERELSKGETAEKERIVKGMKKSLSGFKARYGKDAKSVMYATATKQAKED